MAKYKIITPDNIEVEYTIANLGSRAAATVIDMLIQSVVAFVIMASSLYVFYKTSQVSSTEFIDEYTGWIIALIIIVNFIIIYGYFVFFEMKMNGQTPGKKILKLRSIRKNGQPITLKHSLIRNIFRVFIDNFGPGIISILFTKNHQRLGDMLASTIVVIEGDTTLDEILSFEEQEYRTYKYIITQNEYDMIKGYFSKTLSEEKKDSIQGKMVKYFLEKFEMENLEESKDEFLKDVMNGLVK